MKYSRTKTTENSEIALLKKQLTELYRIVENIRQRESLEGDNTELQLAKVNTSANSDSIRLLNNGVVLSEIVLPSTDDTNFNTVLTDTDRTIFLSGGKTLGTYENLDVITGGTTIQDYLLQMISDVEPVTFDQPSVSLSMSVSPPGSIEKGTNVSITLNATFNQNDAGNIIRYTFIRNGSVIATYNSNLANNQIHIDTFPVDVTTYNYKCNVAYLQGTTPKIDDAGISQPNTINGGNIDSNNRSFKTYYPVYYKDVSSFITDPVLIRSQLSKNTLTINNNSYQFNWDTGTINNKFQIWLPNNFNLSSVIDTDAFDTELVSSFTSVSSIANDANGNPMSGKLYTAEQAVPYSFSHRWVITITT